MGLPSGLQWASCNVGAIKPSDLGLYFSWGNIEGHEEDEGYDFTQAMYSNTPAAAINTDLSLVQDAAMAYLGTPWRMPTAAEFQELYDNCTVVWSTLDGVYGCLFTSNVNGKRLFFPAAGYYDGTTHKVLGSVGFYWSATYFSDTYAISLYFNSTVVNPQYSAIRRYGFTVRAVIQL